jgi:hypothetical protein
MQRFRFTIGSLIGFIVICGVAFAALKESTDWWERGTFSLTVASLVVSVLLAVHRTGERRAFWLGFALFGGCYLGLSLIPPIESRLISSQALADLHARLPGQPTANVAFTVSPAPGPPGQPSGSISVTTTSSNSNQIMVNGPGTMRVWSMNSPILVRNWGGAPENFVRIGHSAIALLLAWSGGMLSRRLSRRSRAMDRSLQDTTVDPLI